MSPDRRRFLGAAFTGAAALAVPSRLAAGPRPSPLPAPGAAPDERFWTLVRAQFSLAPGLVVMNAANLCPAPWPVQERLLAWTRDMDADPSFHGRAGFGGLREASRAAVAGLLGAEPDEIALTRNTSESNNTVVAGLDLGPGDEVVLWDQNHPTNLTSWQVRARRHGFTVRTVSVPAGADDADALAAPFLDALGPRTRVLAFSHVSNSSGVRLPAARLCSEAAARGTFSLVDGAQSCGALHVDVKDLGCDAYSASAHKWLMGPREAGILYVRGERAADLWAADVGVGWEGAEGRGARRFETLGQRDDAAVAAVAAAVAFHEALGGPDAVEGRVLELAAAVRQGLERRFPGVAVAASADPALSGGVVVFRIPGLDHGAAYERLYQEHRVGAARMGEGLRLSPHVYNTLDDVERVLDALAAVA